MLYLIILLKNKKIRKIKYSKSFLFIDFVLLFFANWLFFFIFDNWKKKEKQKKKQAKNTFHKSDDDPSWCNFAIFNEADAPFFFLSKPCLSQIFLRNSFHFGLLFLSKSCLSRVFFYATVSFCYSTGHFVIQIMFISLF